MRKTNRTNRKELGKMRDILVAKGCYKDEKQVEAEEELQKEIEAKQKSR
ncbi:hypothetical protein [Pseudomonas extremaustralis]